MIATLLAYALFPVVFVAVQVVLAVVFATRWPGRARGKSAALAASMMPVMWLGAFAVALVGALRQHPDIGFAPALVGNALVTFIFAGVMWLVGFAIAWLTLRLARLPRQSQTQAGVFE